MDVIDNISLTRTSKLAEEMGELSTKEQQRILNVVETMVRDAKKIQDTQYFINTDFGLQFSFW